MTGFFYNLGKFVGQNARKANWVWQSLTGDDADAVRAEYAVGQDIARSYLQELPVETDPQVQRFLDAVGQRLTACVTDPDRRFWFCCVGKDEYNAFAVPGGFIFVLRPLLDLVDWQTDEVAFVLAHEMSHVLCKHAIRRVMASSAITASMMRVPVGGLIGIGILNVLTSLLTQGYSQDQELEADALAVRLTHYAGFNAAAGISLLNRLNQFSSEGLPGADYFSSHPPVHTRMENLRAALQRLPSLPR